MPYKEKIKEVAANFPGLLKSDRINLLNLQLIDLQNRGFTKLVNKFLSNRSQYTIRPFLFEIYICRWLLSQDKCEEIAYEPDDIPEPPEFIFKIDDQTFQIEAKVITQLSNESVKKKLISQINRQMSSKTKNVIEIWLSEDIESKDINKIVDWLISESILLNIGEKKEYRIVEETLAWIKAVYQSETGGRVGTEYFLGTADGFAQEINIQNIKDKIVAKMKKANNKFKFKCSENTYNLLFITCDANIFLIKETFQEALYGSEAVISYPDKNGNIQWKEILEDNGIWSKEIYSNVDIIFFIKSETNLLEDVFHPYIFPDPYKIEKLKKINEPFSTMKAHFPPTMLGQNIYKH